MSIKKKKAVRLLAQLTAGTDRERSDRTKQIHCTKPEEKVQEACYSPGPGLAAYVVQEGMGYVIKVCPTAYSERGIWYEDAMPVKFPTAETAQMILDNLADDEGWPEITI